MRSARKHQLYAWAMRHSLAALAVAVANTIAAAQEAHTLSGLRTGEFVTFSINEIFGSNCLYSFSEATPGAPTSAKPPTQAVSYTVELKHGRLACTRVITSAGREYRLRIEKHVKQFAVYVMQAEKIRTVYTIEIK